ncbi:MAG: prepilin-type N-terminal cleavage/methylation domain-containing protein [Pyrinomonadaceae bacterium]
MTASTAAHRPSERGFTLVEVSISLVVMMVVGLGVASLFFYSITNNTSAADRELSMAVAQTRMEELRNVAFTDASLAATNGTQENPNPVVGGRTYRVTKTVVDSPTSPPTTKTITIQVEPLSAGPAWQQSNTVFGSVRLVTVRSAVTAGDNLE